MNGDSHVNGLIEEEGEEEQEAGGEEQEDEPGGGGDQAEKGQDDDEDVEEVVEGLEGNGGATKRKFEDDETEEQLDTGAQATPEGSVNGGAGEDEEMPTEANSVAGEDVAGADDTTKIAVEVQQQPAKRAPRKKRKWLRKGEGGSTLALISDYWLTSSRPG